MRGILVLLATDSAVAQGYGGQAPARRKIRRRLRSEFVVGSS